MPGRKTIERGAVIKREKVHAGLVGRRTKHLVQPSQKFRFRPRQAMLVVSEQGRMHGQRGLLQDDATRAETAAGERPAFPQASRNLGQRRLERIGVRADGGRQMMAVEGEQDGRRREGVERGAIVQLLPILAEGSLMDRHMHVAAQAGDADCRKKLRDGA